MAAATLQAVSEAVGLIRTGIDLVSSTSGSDKLDKVSKALTNASRLIDAGGAVIAAIAERQQARAAEGREITAEDVRELMAAGDIKEKLGAARIAQAQAAQDASRAE